MSALLLSCMSTLSTLAAPPESLSSARSSMLAATSHGHLDLRVPSGREWSEFEAGRAAISGAAAYHGFAKRRAGEDLDDGSPLRSLGSSIAETRIMGRAQAFAERFHREGLPVARLWENHSALVSLGLNQKGKLGLWLVQKTH